MHQTKSKDRKRVLTRSNLETDLPLEKEKNPIIKVAIAGVGGVGKTTLCQKAMGKILDDYFDNYKITIGVQFFTHTIKTDNGPVVLSVWDLAGQPQFQQIMDRFLKGSKGVILAYDSTVIDSFFSLYHTWIPLIRENCEENIPILLVSTKNDLADEKEVDPDIVKELLNSKNELNINIIDFLETSSKSNLNVKETFEILCQKILEREQKVIATKKKEGKTDLEEKEIPTFINNP